MGGWVNRCIDGWVNRWIGGWVDRWMGEWVDRWMGGCRGSGAGRIVRKSVRTGRAIGDTATLKRGRPRSRPAPAARTPSEQGRGRSSRRNAARSRERPGGACRRVGGFSRSVRTPTSAPVPGHRCPSHAAVRLSAVGVAAPAAGPAPARTDRTRRAPCQRSGHDVHPMHRCENSSTSAPAGGAAAPRGHASSRADRRPSRGGFRQGCARRRLSRSHRPQPRPDGTPRRAHCPTAVPVPKPSPTRSSEQSP